MMNDAILPSSTTANWPRRTANWISQLACPPVLGVAALILLAINLQTTAAWRWVVSYCLLVIGLPVAYVVWQVRRGKLADIHLPRREERIRPLLFTLLSSGVAWLVLLVYEAPALLTWFALINLVQTTIFLTITMYWKISLHTATAANLALVALLCFGQVALPLLISVPLIAWARIHLQRHTLGQTAAGALLGSVTILSSLWML